MGVCASSHLPTSPGSLPSYPEYTGAGILFAEGPVALAGIQKYYRVVKGAQAVLSGLGGAKEAADTDWLDTAWREVIEELLGVPVVPTALLRALRASVPLPIPPRTSYMSGYVLLHLGFAHLTKALALCRSHGLRGPLYKTTPVSVSDLIFLRCASNHTEIGPLALLPVSHRFVVAGEFMGDLATYHAENPRLP